MIARPMLISFDCRSDNDNNSHSNKDSGSHSEHVSHRRSMSASKPHLCMSLPNGQDVKQPVSSAGKKAVPNSPPSAMIDLTASSPIASPSANQSRPRSQALTVRSGSHHHTTSPEGESQRWQQPGDDVTSTVPPRPCKRRKLRQSSVDHIIDLTGSPPPEESTSSATRTSIWRNNARADLSVASGLPERTSRSTKCETPKEPERSLIIPESSPLSPRENNQRSLETNLSRSVPQTLGSNGAPPRFSITWQKAASRESKAGYTSSPARDTAKPHAEESAETNLTAQGNSTTQQPPKLVETRSEGAKEIASALSLTVENQDQHSAESHAATSKDPDGLQDENPPESIPRYNNGASFRVIQPSSAKIAVPVHPNVPMSIMIERVVGQAVEKMRSDTEHWSGVELQRARLSADSRPRRTDDEEPTSAFRDLKPARAWTKTTNDNVIPQRPFAEFCVQSNNYSSSKFSRTSYLAKCTAYSTRKSDVPSYSHFVSIRHSFLAHNKTNMQHLPYFGDDFMMSEAQCLKAQYFLDVDSRERKLLRLGQAESFAAYAEDMLAQAGCTWSDVLRFLLEPIPDVGTDGDAKISLAIRHKLCAEDFVRVGERWTSVLAQLPTSKSQNIGRAAVLCEQFQKIAGFPLWHIARRSEYTRTLLEAREGDALPNEDELTCRICMRFNCLYHGQMNETHNQDAECTDAADEAVETDIIHPHKVNWRRRIGLTPSVEDDTKSLVTTQYRRKQDYWQKGQFAKLAYRPEGRTPFYPCHHPGSSCESVECSCYRDMVPCEKICGCSWTCQRKFQGCCCSKGKQGQKKLMCFEDERCACFQTGRECDPDLCGDCGVCEVLDPVHRYDDAILLSRCRNANVQRGVPKHTILGDSAVHGFGLYACEDVSTHDFVGEYKGEIITKEEADRRGAVYEHQKLSYLFSLNERQEIDSTYFGNRVRFINHADKSKCNLYARIIMVNTVHHIALYGACKIRAGEELFFDYGPMFPDEQLGGRKAPMKEAAPRVRNSELLKQFYDIEKDRGQDGTVRIRKVADKNSDGGSDRSSIAGAEPADPKAKPAVRPRRRHGGARIGAGRPRKHHDSPRRDDLPRADDENVQERRGGQNVPEDGVTGDDDFDPDAYSSEESALSGIDERL